MKHIADILKGLASNFLFTLLGFICVSYVLSSLYRYGLVWQPDLIISVLLAVFVTVALIWIGLCRRPLRIHNGREGAMEANTRLLGRKAPRDRAKRRILSTRVSYWPSDESSPVRKKFRALLTEKIEEGILVKRIWQLHTKDDLERMKTFLGLYKHYDNYALACFVGNSPFIPEVLSVYGRDLSVSIPQSEDPRKLTTAFHFRGRKEIERWEQYFKILWADSEVIKEGNRIFYDRLERLDGQIDKDRQ